MGPSNSKFLELKERPIKLLISSELKPSCLEGRGGAGRQEAHGIYKTREVEKVKDFLMSHPDL